MLELLIPSELVFALHLTPVVFGPFVLLNTVDGHPAGFTN